LALLIVGCGNSTVIGGRALSMAYDPYRAGGLPAADGPSGVRPNAPRVTGTVSNTDNGPIDQLAQLGINDIEDFWGKKFPEAFHAKFKPVSKLISYDSESRSGPSVCGGQSYGRVNASYCINDDVMAWDRGVLMPVVKEYFEDMAVIAVLAHEYGHAVQWSAKLVNKRTPTVVDEQQADCFAGVYLRWVAEGKSPRFALSTGDGLNYVLAGVVASRDPVLTPDDSDLLEEGHGTALDRVGAFQIGFDEGAERCAKIDMNDIKTRRGDLPMSLQVDSQGRVQSGDVPITADLLSEVMKAMDRIFAPANPPTLTMDPAQCADARASDPVSYCPSTNTISANLPALQELGRAANEVEDEVLVKGDNSAISLLMSRYTLAVQRERNVALTSGSAALRTACLTAVAQRKLADSNGSGQSSLTPSAGDVDEAVSGLLTNGLVASDVNGETVPAGFTRILAYRLGLSGEADACFVRFA
jgi:predicted metalloprotease